MLGLAGPARSECIVGNTEVEPAGFLRYSIEAYPDLDAAAQRQAIVRRALALQVTEGVLDFALGFGGDGNQWEAGRAAVVAVEVHGVLEAGDAVARGDQAGGTAFSFHEAPLNSACRDGETDGRISRCPTSGSRELLPPSPL
jgi:hypothetical protein